MQHTWPAYRGAMSIFFEDWATALQQLIEAGVAVKLIVGSDDHSRVPGLADQLAGIRRTSPLFQSPTRLIFCRSLTANSVSMKSS
ncbi:MAG: hypothetical protein ABI233_09440 [Chthoniobacterales bacterium]